MKLTTLRLAAGALLLVLAAPVMANQLFVPVTPCRVFDTRAVGSQTDGNPLPNPGPHPFRIQGNCGVPNGAAAVSYNVTVVGATTFGDLRLYPFDQVPSGSDPSTINYPAGEALANGLILPLAAVAAPADDDMKIIIGMTVSGTVHVIFDVMGFFVDLQAGNGLDLTGTDPVVMSVQTCADGEILVSDTGTWVCGPDLGGGGGGGGFAFAKDDVYEVVQPATSIPAGSTGSATAQCADANDIAIEGFCSVNNSDLLIAYDQSAANWTTSLTAASFTCSFKNTDTSPKNGHTHLFCVGVPGP